MKRSLIFIAIISIASLLPIIAFGKNGGRSFEIGETVFSEDFDGPDALRHWSGSVGKPFALVEGEAAGSKALRIDLPLEGDSRGAVISRDLPVEPLRNLRLKITARVRLENVETPPNPWNGVKVMLVLDRPEGKQWLQHNLAGGASEWKTVTFHSPVSPTATRATLVLGLENVRGRVDIDDLRITVVGKRRTVPSTGRNADDDDAKSARPYTGHDLPRLRGAMISPSKFGPEDIEVFAGKWKANHVRWQMTWAGFPNGPADSATVEEFDTWIDQQCARLDKMLPECEKYGVRVCLDLHTPPGGRLPRETGSAMRLFREPQFQDAFVATWIKLAKRYKNSPAIWSYDLLNEPVEGELADGLLDWRALALKTAKEIRKIDPDRAIVIEPAPWGSPEALDWFEPFDTSEVPNVVYSVHMYIPHAFTHQGVYESPVGLVYPGMIDGKEWNKAELRKALRAPIEFAADYNAHIYLGEFSAIRWAPDDSAYRYLKDCIEIFEEEGWDWAYHAFREWNGWSVEHGPDKNDNRPAAEPTDRELLLRSWFEKNGR